ncbi:septation protein A [Buchnera aphidicola (Hormaphis cornu)]|nr:septation protein A [Buchnera aphidicola (Hormaphis cornu)]
MSYKNYNIFIALKILIIVSIITFCIKWFIFQDKNKLNLIHLCFLSIFGSLTIIFKTTVFIKWKITILYFVLALILIISQSVFNQILVKKLFGQKIHLNELIWKKVNLNTSIFCIICGISNIYVAFWMPEKFWVTFKTFILAIATIIFTLANILYIIYLKKNNF